MTTSSPIATAAPVATIDAAGTALATTPPGHRLSVVVPMYNEIENAAPLIDAVQAALASYPSPWELIVVDDGSRDGTGAALVRHAATVGPHIHVIRLARNFRQTAAMQAGIDAARGDVIVTMDGDLQNDPADIPTLVAKLLDEKLDMVAGWREKRKDGWILRKIPSWLANRLITRITGLKFHDLGCSLKAFRASVLKQVRLYGEMHRFIPAWLATVTSPDRMGEVPVRHHARLRGTSKYGISRTLRVVVDVLSIYFFLNFGSRPGHFFGVIGLAVTSLGSLMLGYLAVLKIMGENIGGRPLLMLGFFLVVGGLQFLMTGVLAELLVRIYFDGNHAKSYTALPAAETFGADGGWSRS